MSRVMSLGTISKGWGLLQTNQTSPNHLKTLVMKVLTTYGQSGLRNIMLRLRTEIDVRCPLYANTFTTPEQPRQDNRAQVVPEVTMLKKASNRI